MDNGSFTACPPWSFAPCLLLVEVGPTTCRKHPPRSLAAQHRASSPRGRCRCTRRTRTLSPSSLNKSLRLKIESKQYLPRTLSYGGQRGENRSIHRRPPAGGFIRMIPSFVRSIRTSSLARHSSSSCSSVSEDRRPAYAAKSSRRTAEGCS